MYKILTVIMLLLFYTISFSINTKSEEYFSKKYNLKFVDNNYVEILKNGDEILSKYLEIINKAEKFIYIETFIFHADEFGEKFAEAIIEKAKEGLDIILIYDIFGSFPYSAIDKEFYEKIEREGIKLIKYHDFLEKGIFEIQDSWHRKTIIVDNKYAFIGGTNLNNHVYKREKDFLSFFGASLEANLDTTIFLKGPIVYEMYKDYVDFLKYNYFIPEKKYEPNNDLFRENIRGSVVSFHKNMEDKDKILEDIFIDLIDKSKKEILMQIGYFIPTQRLINSFINASKRGVKIEILISFKEISNMPWREEFSKYIYKKLIDNGIKIYSHNYSPVHSKIAIFDETFSTVGTVNIDRRSMFLDCESMILFNSEYFSRELKDWFNEGINNAKILDLSYLEDIGMMKLIFNASIEIYTILIRLMALR